MSYGSLSNVEFRLETKFECSLVAKQVCAVDTEGSCCNVFEQEGRQLIRNWDIELAAHFHLSHMVFLRVVMLYNDQSFFEGRLSIDVEDTLSIKISTSNPYSMLLWYLEVTSTFKLSKYPLKFDQLKASFL